EPVCAGVVVVLVAAGAAGIGAPPWVPCTEPFPCTDPFPCAGLLPAEPFPWTDPFPRAEPLSGAAEPLAVAAEPAGCCEPGAPGVALPPMAAPLTTSSTRRFCC